MENERYKNILERCEYLDTKLQRRYYELLDEGEKAVVLNDIARTIKSVQRIHKKVNIDNLDKCEDELSNIEYNVLSKYGIGRVAKEEVKEEKAEVVEVVEKKPCEGAVLAGILGGAIIGGAATYLYLNRNRGEVRTAIVQEEENTEVLNETRNVTVAEQNAIDSRDLTEEEAVNQSINLVLGEYGTFFDAHDEKQVQARAQYIYDNYFARFENEISDGRLSKMFGEHKDHISVDGIANVIRSMNGIPRIDKDGNYYVTANMGDQILNEAAFYLLNVPSACYDQNDVKVYHNVPAHLFVADDSEASRFLKGYDEAYEEFCEAMNRNDGQGAYNAGAKIAEKCGMNGIW